MPLASEPFFAGSGAHPDLLDGVAHAPADISSGCARRLPAFIRSRSDPGYPCRARRAQLFFVSA